MIIQIFVIESLIWKDLFQKQFCQETGSMKSHQCDFKREVSVMQNKFKSDFDLIGPTWYHYRGIHAALLVDPKNILQWWFKSLQCTETSIFNSGWSPLSGIILEMYKQL